MFAFVISFIIVIYVPLIFFSFVNTESPDRFGGWEAIHALFFVIAYRVFVFLVLVVTFGLRVGLFRIMRQKDMDIIGKDDYFFFLRKPYRSKRSTCR